MFDILPNTITTCLTILFPIFAAHKALTTTPSNPALLQPWLTYFLVLALAQTAESYLSPILSFVPLYGFFRLFVYIYLLLPGPNQGASFLYTKHIAPWIRNHEHTIEGIIADAHDRARQLGLGQIEKLWELLRERIFGVDVQKESAMHRAAEGAMGVPASNSYVSGLLGRFSAGIPAASAGIGSAPSGTDVVGMLSAAVGALGNSSPGSGSKSTGRSRADISSKRDELRRLLHELDGEAARMERDGEGGFESIDRSEARRPEGGRRSASWGNWLFGEKDKDASTSSGVDLAYGDK